MLGEAYLVLTSLTLRTTQKTRDLDDNIYLDLLLLVSKVFRKTCGTVRCSVYKELNRYLVPETNRIKESLWQVDSFKFSCQMHHIVFLFSVSWEICQLRFCFENPKEQSDPTARYTLNLMHPQHRALLRMLLRCRGWKTWVAFSFPMFFDLRKLRISFQLFLQLRILFVVSRKQTERRSGSGKFLFFETWLQHVTGSSSNLRCLLRRCRSQSRPVTELFKFED